MTPRPDSPIIHPDLIAHLGPLFDTVTCQVLRTAPGDSDDQGGALLTPVLHGTVSGRLAPMETGGVRERVTGDQMRSEISHYFDVILPADVLRDDTVVDPTGLRYLVLAVHEPSESGHYLRLWLKQTQPQRQEA